VVGNIGAQEWRTGAAARWRSRAHWFTVVIDREGYSPDLFSQLCQKRIALLTYHKFPKDDWSAEEFSSHSVTLAWRSGHDEVAERGSRLSNNLWVREIRRLTTAATKPPC